MCFGRDVIYLAYTNQIVQFNTIYPIVLLIKKPINVLISIPLWSHIYTYIYINLSTKKYIILACILYVYTKN